MRFKRLLALLLAAALALAVLVGCGSGQQSAAQALLKLLDGKYPNISIEIDPDLEADLRQAISQAEAENAGDDDAVIRAALEKLVGSTVTFRNLGDGQQGDTTFDLVFYAGTDPDKAAQAAYTTWNTVFANVPDDGKYGTGLAMVETENGIWMLVKATVEKAGTEDKAEPVTLKSIVIAQNPTKTKYKDGVAFDPTGMKITATYSDGSTKTIDGTSTDVTFSPETITDGTTSVTVFYGGKQTAVSVECITLDHISVNLTLREYTVDEELISSNVTIKAVYSDNITTETIEPGKCSFTLGTTPITLPYKFSKGGNYTLTVTYDGKTSDPVNIHVTDQNGYHEESSGNYVVTGTDGLQNLYSSNQSNFATAKITLESPVTLDASWPENITFTGELNGNGNTITMKGNRKQGLFNEIGNGGTVENVHLQIDGTIRDGSGAVGGIAGTLWKGTITGCSVELNGGSIQATATGTGDALTSACAGGIVGTNGGTIEHCDVTISGSITADASSTNWSFTEAHAGGIAGLNDSTIESSCSVELNNGTIKATGTGDDRTLASAGGIAGNDFIKGVKCGPATGTGTIKATVTGTSNSNGSVTLTLKGSTVAVAPNTIQPDSNGIYKDGYACAGTKTAS